MRVAAIPLARPAQALDAMAAGNTTKRTPGTDCIYTPENILRPVLHFLFRYAVRGAISGAF